MIQQQPDVRFRLQKLEKLAAGPVKTVIKDVLPIKYVSPRLGQDFTRPDEVNRRLWSLETASTSRI
jgi:hypothetical protein